MISTTPHAWPKRSPGAEAIFLMHVGTGIEQTRTMIAAAQDAAVPRIVLLSSAGARLLPLDDNPMGAAFAAREQILRESGLGVTYLRPSAFASNASNGFAAPAANGFTTSAIRGFRGKEIIPSTRGQRSVSGSGGFPSPRRTSGDRVVEC